MGLIDGVHQLEQLIVQSAPLPLEHLDLFFNSLQLFGVHNPSTVQPLLQFFDAIVGAFRFQFPFAEGGAQCRELCLLHVARRARGYRRRIRCQALVDLVEALGFLVQFLVEVLKTEQYGDATHSLPDLYLSIITPFILHYSLSRANLAL